MKNNIFKFIVVLFSIIIFAGCDSNSDASKFKNEYESLNEQTINGKTVRSVTIGKNNPFVYKEAKDIIKMMDNKESFVVYFGFAKCPWCRSVIETLEKVAKDEGLNTIYYVDVLDIRDTLKVNDNNEVVTDKKGTDDYYKLLEYFGEVLSDYKLNDNNNEKIETNEKRIYAPNVVSVVDGKAKELTTGISSKQDDAYMTLTEEIKKETYNNFKCIIKCVLESKNSCSIEKEC